MRTVAVVVGYPHRNLRPGVAKTGEQGLVEQFLAHATVEILDEGILDRLAWRDEVPVDEASLHPASMALQVNSVPLSETIGSPDGEWLEN